jgi:hypothetical protein
MPSLTYALTKIELHEMEFFDQSEPGSLEKKGGKKCHLLLNKKTPPSSPLLV